VQAGLLFDSRVLALVRRSTGLEWQKLNGFLFSPPLLRISADYVQIDFRGHFARWLNPGLSIVSSESTMLVELLGVPYASAASDWIVMGGPSKEGFLQLAVKPSGDLANPEAQLHQIWWALYTAGLRPGSGQQP